MSSGGPPGIFKNVAFFFLASTAFFANAPRLVVVLAKLKLCSTLKLSSETIVSDPLFCVQDVIVESSNVVDAVGAHVSPCG